MKNDQLQPFREIMGTYCDSNNEHMNTPYGRNVECVALKRVAHTVTTAL